MKSQFLYLLVATLATILCVNSAQLSAQTKNPRPSLCPTCTFQTPTTSTNYPTTKPNRPVARQKSANVPFVLNFEGLGNEDAINEFYNGGTSASGASGVDFGITFSGSSLALIDSDAGGTGNIANEPSPSTVLFSLSNSLTANVDAGFGTGVSFFYLNNGNVPLNLEIYSQLDGQGTLLATGSYATVPIGTVGGDPNGEFDNWVGLNLPFNGQAQSVVISGQANQFAFDDFSVGAIRPDQDLDNVIDASDNCPMQANFDQTDTDGDGTGDACEICPNDPSCVIVHCESGSTYNSIQAAVNALRGSSSATLLLPPGMYTEDVDFTSGSSNLTVIFGESCD